MTSLMQSLQKIWPWQPIHLPLNLQRREKIILALGVLALVLFLFLQLAVFPILDYRTRLKTLLNYYQTEEMAKIQSIKAEKEALARNSQLSEILLKRRQNGFNLFSFLESLAGRSGIKQIESMKPSSANLKNSPYTLNRVDMKINGLSSEQLVAFLHGIETANQMAWIKGISITRNDQNDGLINALLQVETIER